MRIAWRQLAFHGIQGSFLTRIAATTFNWMTPKPSRTQLSRSSRPLRTVRSLTIERCSRGAENSFVGVNDGWRNIAIELIDRTVREIGGLRERSSRSQKP